MSEEKKNNRSKISFEVVQQGAYGTHPKEFQGALVVQSKEEGEKIGLKKEVIEKTDFSTHFLLYLSAGQKPTGGYKIIAKRVFQKDSSGKLEIFAKEESSSIATMALTMPYTVIRLELPPRSIPKNEFKINWRE